MKKIAIYMYETSPIFEISIISYLLNTKYDIFIVTNDKFDIKTSEGISIKSDIFLSDINIDEFEALIICGGDYDKNKENFAVLDYIIKFEAKNKLIAGICSGRDLINFALNKNYDISDSVEYVDKNIIFSPPNKYAMFGIIVGKYLKIYKDEDDYSETVEFFASSSAT